MHLRRILAALVVALAVGLGAGWARAESVKLTLLHTNDVYEISAKDGSGGLAELMTLLQAERRKAAHSITTFGGDLISPSLMSGITKGAQMIALMNAIGVDVAGLGNHEFDFGADLLAERMAASKFTWLASNTLGGDGKPFGGARATLLRQVGGLAIGFFALLTPETAELSSPGPSVSFLPLDQTARAMVKSLRASGADVVIALTHLSLARDRELARAVKGIDVILGGHDHDPMTVYEGGTLIIKAGHDAQYLAAVNLSISKREGEKGPMVKVLPEWRYLSTHGVAPDPGIAALVKSYEAQLSTELDVFVGTTSVELDSRRGTVRGAESNFADLVADAMRHGVGADVALTNGGSIRGDRTYPAGSKLTRRDVLSELPFGNVVVLLELTGAQLLAALEHGVSAVAHGAGRFPQVSGLTFSYDPARPVGSRVLRVDVGGRPLEAGERYRVASNDYIAGGGDGYAVLKQGKVIIDASGGRLMASMVMRYIAALGTVAPTVEGRITRR